MFSKKSVWFPSHLVQQNLACTFVCVCLLAAAVCFEEKPRLSLQMSRHTHTVTHTHIYKLVATGLLLQRRRINAVRTQFQCNVFVYCRSEALAPPEQPDCPLPSTTSTSQGTSPPLSFHNWSAEGGDGCVPRGVKTWQLFFFPPPFLCLPLSVSCLLLLFAQALNVLVQTLFPPAGRAEPYARPVKAAVVMDTGKHQNKMSTPDSWGSVTLHLSFIFYCLFYSSFFFPHQKTKTPVKLCCGCTCTHTHTHTTSPAHGPETVQVILLCGAPVHSVPFSQTLSSCSWGIRGKLWAQLPLYLLS